MSSKNTEDDLFDDLLSHLTSLTNEEVNDDSLEYQDIDEYDQQMMYPMAMVDPYTAYATGIYYPYPDYSGYPYDQTLMPEYSNMNDYEHIPRYQNSNGKSFKSHQSDVNHTDFELSKESNSKTGDFEKNDNKVDSSRNQPPVVIVAGSLHDKSDLVDFTFSGELNKSATTEGDSDSSQIICKTGTDDLINSSLDEPSPKIIKLSDERSPTSKISMKMHTISCDNSISSTSDHCNVSTYSNSPFTDSGNSSVQSKYKPLTNIVTSFVPSKDVFEKEIRFIKPDNSDPQNVDKARKNAIQARINRQKKKQEMDILQEKIQEMDLINDNLKLENTNLVKERQCLNDEITYLKNILNNQSTLSNILSKISNSVDSINLTSSFRARNVCFDHDNPVEHSSKCCLQKVEPSGGVCLHINKNKVTLEFCAECAKMASGSCLKESS